MCNKQTDRCEWMPNYGGKCVGMEAIASGKVGVRDMTMVIIGFIVRFRVKFTVRVTFEI